MSKSLISTCAMLCGLLSVACQSTSVPRQESRLTGTGFVVGLAHTGSTSPALTEAIVAWARERGLTLRPSDIAPGSVALVHLSCALPATARVGQKTELHCEALEDGVSLRGGHLLRAELRDQDGNMWAVAQGSVIVTSDSTIPADAPPSPAKSGWLMQGAVFLRDR